MYRLGVDVGGTFTDVLLFNDSSGHIHRTKVPSTPKDQSEGIAEGVLAVLDERAQTRGGGSVPPWDDGGDQRDPRTQGRARRPPCYSGIPPGRPHRQIVRPWRAGRLDRLGPAGLARRPRRRARGRRTDRCRRGGDRAAGRGSDAQGRPFTGGPWDRDDLDHADQRLCQRQPRAARSADRGGRGALGTRVGLLTHPARAGGVRPRADHGRQRVRASHHVGLSQQPGRAARRPRRFR